MKAAEDTLTAALAGRYRIERKLGAGGMATVYLARDLRHERDVALKVLNPDIAESLGRERFLREIKLAARLNHPHILPLHDSGEAGGFLFFVMPVMAGQTLRDRLLREKRLPVDAAVRIASEVADALDYAHRHDVVHRDIKPENILLHEGHALVADFGIGKAVAAAATHATTLTQAGVVIGTPAYMSPEQAAGDEVDGRSDLFSLGCVLFEILTGDLPFTGATMQAVIARRFHHTPPAVTTLRPDVSPAVSQALQRLLARDPGERIASGALVIAALHAPVAASAPPTEGPSVAVLPFANMSPDPADGYFADGITEEIINVLAQLQGLRVAARTSCFAFKGKAEDLRTVGEKLGVRTVLQGSVRKAGPKLRVTAQLISAADGYHLWSERYDREMTDVFALQDEIAGAIAAKLQVSLLDARALPARRGPRSVEAYEALLKGRTLLALRGRAILEAIECFKRAVALDGELVDAHAALGDGYDLLAVYGMAAPTTVVPLARASLERALALDPENADALATLGRIVDTFDFDYAGSRALFARALAQDPRNIRALVEDAIVVLQREAPAGEMAAAYGQMRRAREFDPLNTWAAGVQSMCLTANGLHDDAVRAAEDAVRIDPSAYTGHLALVSALSGARREIEALAAAETGLSLFHRGGRMLADCAAIHARLGNASAAETIHHELSSRAEAGYVSWCEQGVVAASAGRGDLALSLVAKSIGAREPWLLFWKLPAWGPFRNDPEGMAMLRAAGVCSA